MLEEMGFQRLMLSFLCDFVFSNSNCELHTVSFWVTTNRLWCMHCPGLQDCLSYQQQNLWHSVAFVDQMQRDSSCGFAFLLSSATDLSQNQIYIF